MNLTDWLTYEVEIGNYTISIQDIIISLLLIALLSLIFLLTKRRWLPRLFQNVKEDIELKERQRINRSVNIVFIVTLLAGLLITLNLNQTIYISENEKYTLSVNTLLVGVLIFTLARLSDWLISKWLIQNYKDQRKKNTYDKATLVTKVTNKEKEEHRAGQMIQSIVYGFLVFFLLKLLQIDELLPQLPVGSGDRMITITASKIVFAITVIFIARLISWIIIQIALFNYYKTNNIHIGGQYAVNQLVRYFIFFFAIIIALQNLGLQLTVVWGSVAALLVGVGLGLQQTFNDWASGIILLLERSVEVGDVVQIDGAVGRVRKIGLRVSRVQTLENISILVPNSHLVNEKVINWSHYDNKARFIITVGVAYGSDTTLIKELLLEVAKENEAVLKYPEPFVRFVNFGNSSLDFELHVWIKDLIQVENHKSSLRFAIDQAFRKHHVQIPFPQMDVWLKKEE